MLCYKIIFLVLSFWFFKAIDLLTLLYLDALYDATMAGGEYTNFWLLTLCGKFYIFIAS